MPNEEVLVYRVQVEGAEEAARQLDRLEQRVQRARQTAAAGAGGTAGGAFSATSSVTRAAQASAAVEAAAVQRAAASRSSLGGAFGQSAFGPAIAGLAVGLGTLPLQQLTQAGLQANRQIGAYDPARARIDIERQAALSRFGRSAESVMQPLDRFGTGLLNAAGPAGGLVAGAAAVGQGVGAVAGIGSIVAGLGAVAAALGANTAATAANTAARGGGAIAGAAGGGLAGLGPLLAGAGPLAAAAGVGLGGAGVVGVTERQAGPLAPFIRPLIRALGPAAGAFGAPFIAGAGLLDAFGVQAPRAAGVADAVEVAASARLRAAESNPAFVAFDRAQQEQALVPERVAAFQQAQLGQAQGAFALAGQRRGIAIQREADLLSTQQFAQRQVAEQRELMLATGRAYEQIGIGAGRQAREAFIGAGISRREIGIGAAQQLADIQRSTAISQREIGIGAVETRSDIEQNYTRGRRNLVLGQIGGLAGAMIGLRTQRRDALADLEENVGRQRGRVARGAGDATDAVGIGAGRALAGAERGFADQLDAIARSRGDAEADLSRQTSQQVEDLKTRQTQEAAQFKLELALRERERLLLESQLTVQEGLVKKLKPTVDDQITAYDALTTHLKDLNKFLEQQLGTGTPTAPEPSTQATRRSMPNY